MPCLEVSILRIMHKVPVHGPGVKEKAALDAMAWSADCDCQRRCLGCCPTVVQAAGQDEGTGFSHYLVSIKGKIFSPERNL